MNIVLASSSIYRKALLSKILPTFEQFSPNIDESERAHEKPDAMARRLAEHKAKAGHGQFEDALIIGSDQVAFSDNHQLTKAGNRESNINQLKRCSGKEITFYTGLAVFNTRSTNMQSSVEVYKVKFKHLTTKQITHYVEREQAFDCAGGFKVEGLGISLFEYVRGDDPNTLVGLPLIRLTEMLVNQGYRVV